MRKPVLIVWAVCMAIFFSMVAGRQVKSQAPVGDDLSQALVNHGMDAGSSVPAAIALEAALASNNLLLARVSKLEIPQPAVSAGYVITVPSAWPLAGSCVIPVGAAACSSGPTLKNGGTYFTTVLLGGTSGGPGSSFDYLVNIPADGNYAFSANVAVTSGGAPFALHLETPSGPLPGSSFTYTPPNTNPFVAKGSSAFALKAGVNILRLAVDQAGPAGWNGVDMINWFRLTKQ